MKISIITVTFNSARTLKRTLKSVADQSYEDIEHILIDGQSTDGTVEIIRSEGIDKWVSEPDQGMYDALNKGIQMATGEVIGILNSDDCLNDNSILTKIANEFKVSPEAQLIYGDVRFVSTKNSDKTVRYYSSAHFEPYKFALGYMPAHPSVYVRKEVYEKYGVFKTDYQIAADYEWLTRVIYKHGIKTKYMPLLIADMLPGGLSNASIKSRYLLNKEIVKACAENGLQTNMWKLSLKYTKKILEYIPFRH